MKKLFSLIALLSLAVGFTACEEKTPDTPDTATVALSATKTEIMADGVETVSFEATVNGVVTSDGVQIICLNDNSVLSGASFKTTTAGEYRFVAVSGGAKSNEVKVVAKALKVMMSQSYIGVSVTRNSYLLVYVLVFR